MTATRTPPAQALARLAQGTTEEIHEIVRRRSVSLHARMRLAEAIRAIAVDMCGGDEALSAADRAWLRKAIAAPVNEATEEALRALVNELARALHSAPPRVRPTSVTPLVSRTDFE